METRLLKYIIVARAGADLRFSEYMSKVRRALLLLSLVLLLAAFPFGPLFPWSPWKPGYERLPLGRPGEAERTRLFDLMTRAGMQVT